MGKATVASRLVSAKAVCPPRRLSGKDDVCRSRRRGFDPWVGKIPVEEEMANRLQCSGLGNSMARGAWQATVCVGTRVRQLSTHTTKTACEIFASLATVHQKCLLGCAEQLSNCPKLKTPHQGQNGQIMLDTLYSRILNSNNNNVTQTCGRGGGWDRLGVWVSRCKLLHPE